MKKIVAKVGEFTNSQGETKGRYTNIGVILSNDKGEYILLDPTVSLAGVMAKQEAYAESQGRAARDSVIASIFAEDGGRQAPQAQRAQPKPAAPDDGLNDDIPF